MHLALDRRRLLGAAAAALVAAPVVVGARRAGAQSAPGAALQNIADTLVGLNRYNGLVEMIGRAGLTDQLRGAEPVTLFAPTDAAMAGAPAAMIQDLMQQGTGGTGGGTLGGASPDLLRLRAFLQYHSVLGVRPFSSLQPNTRLRTINGADVQVVSTPNGGLALVNPAPGQQPGSFGAAGINVMPPAPIVQPDIRATNGVIHGIGGVLFP